MEAEIKQEIEKFYDDWKQDSEAQNEHIETLKQIFPDTKFTDNRPPTFFAGQLDAPIVIIGLNPGYSEKDVENDWELQQKNDSFEDYWNFSQNFFQRCAEQEKGMNYYSSFSKFIRGLNNYEYKEKARCPDYLNYLEGKVLNIDLIPYHSTSIDSIDPSESEIQEVLKRYEEIVRKIIDLHDREYVIITGKNNYKYWKSEKDFNLRKVGTYNKRIDYTKTEFKDWNTIVLKLFFPGVGLTTQERYLLGQALR